MLSGVLFLVMKPKESAMKDYCYIVRVGKRFVGDLGGMTARGSRTGTKCPGEHRQTVLFTQISLAYQPRCRAA